MAGDYGDERGREWRGERPRARRDDETSRGPREPRSFRDGGDRVFGERDSGAGYNQPPRDDWQDRRYGGVSPAMRQGEYDIGPTARRRHDRDDYGRGDRRDSYGPAPRDYEQGQRFGTREADERFLREMRRPASGGTGGYDYERGYGDAGRGQGDDFEDHAREAGEFFRRTGRKISNWFSDATSEMGMDDDADRRSHRGRGPKGYKRSDERINDDVHERLTDDHWLDARDIHVAVSDGEVTLSGSVASREAKHRAERIVEDLSGVTHVQNNLRIADGGSSYTPAGSGSGSVGEGRYGAGVQGGHLREEGDAANVTSANARNKT